MNSTSKKLKQELSETRCVLPDGYLLHRQRELRPAASEDEIADHAARVAAGYAAEEAAVRTLDELRRALDHALRAARGARVSYKRLAIAVIESAGTTAYAADVARLDGVLRQRVMIAQRRVSIADDQTLASSRNLDDDVDVHPNHAQEILMAPPSNDNDSPFLKTKTVTVTQFEYATPDVYIDGDDAEDDPDLVDDHEVADVEEVPPAAAPTRARAQRR